MNAYKFNPRFVDVSAVDDLLGEHPGLDAEAVLDDLGRRRRDIIRVLQQARTHAFDSPSFPTPYEIGRAGWNGEQGTDATWAGKRVLQQWISTGGRGIRYTQGWRAVKWLARASDDAPTTRHRVTSTRAGLPADRFARPFLPMAATDPGYLVVAEAVVPRAELAGRQERAARAVEAARVAAESARVAAVTPETGAKEVPPAAVDEFLDAVRTLPVGHAPDTIVDTADLGVVAEFAAAGLGAEHVTLELLGEDGQTAVYRVRTGATTIGVVKLVADVTRLIHEVSGLDQLAAAGVQVPRPKDVAVLPGRRQPWGPPARPAGIMVASLAPGRSLGERAAEFASLRGQARAEAMQEWRQVMTDVGAALAQLHVRPAGAGANLSRRALAAAQQWGEEAVQKRVAAEVRTVTDHRQALEAAGLDVDRLLRVMTEMRETPAPGLARRGIPALLHGDLHSENIFWHPDHGVTLIDAELVDEWIDADGKPEGWAGLDIELLRSTLFSLPLPMFAGRPLPFAFGPAEMRELDGLLRDAYVAAGGSWSTEGRFAELVAAVGELTRRLAATSDMDAPAGLEQQLAEAVQALNEALSSVDPSADSAPPSGPADVATPVPGAGQTIGTVPYPRRDRTSDHDIADRNAEGEPDGLSRDESRPAPPWVAEGHRPLIGELIPHTEEQAARWGREARAAFFDRFAGVDFAGYEITDRSPEDALSVGVSVSDGRVTDANLVFEITRDGVRRGHASVGFRRMSDGTLVIDVSTLVLDERAQHGGGFTGAFLQHLESWAAESGVDRIELKAGHLGGVVGGRYVWAQHGFDWAPDTKGVVDNVLGHLARERDAVEVDVAALRSWFAGDDAVDIRTLLDKHRAVDPSALLADLERQSREATEILHQAATNDFDSPGFPTPYELSRAGWNGTRGPDATWIGKRAIMADSWEAVRWINPASGEAPRTGLRAYSGRTNLPASRFSGKSVPTTEPRTDLAIARATLPADDLARRQELAERAVQGAREVAQVIRAEGPRIKTYRLDDFAGAVQSLPVQGRAGAPIIRPADLGVLAEFAAEGVGAESVTLERIGGIHVGRRSANDTAVYRVRVDGEQVAVVKVVSDARVLIQEIIGLDRLAVEGVQVPAVSNVAVFDTPHGTAGAVVMAAAPGRSLAEKAAALTTLSGDAREAAMQEWRRIMADAGTALADMHVRPAGSGRPLPGPEMRLYKDLIQGTFAGPLQDTANTFRQWRRVLEPAGLDVGGLSEVLDDVVGDAHARRAGTALVHGDANFRNLFWHPEHGITFIDVRGVALSIDADGVPTGWAGRDLRTFQSELHAPGVAFSPQEQDELDEIFRTAYVEAGGSLPVEPGWAGRTELERVVALVDEFRTGPEPVRRAEIRLELLGAVQALNEAVGLRTPSPTQLAQADRESLRELAERLLDKLRRAAELMGDPTAVPTFELANAVDAVPAVAQQADYAVRAATSRADAARARWQSLRDAPAGADPARDAAAVEQARLDSETSDLLAREAAARRAALAPALDAVTRLLADPAESGTRPDLDALVTHTDALAELVAELQTGVPEADVPTLPADAPAPPPSGPEDITASPLSDTDVR
ncbi:MAG TPA: hypothetical protein VGR21_06400, partial [Cryptosporangiaceae bacterium]|nr:hypothetical protein [Cryptosporangiaceae bacterium]